MTSSQNCSCLLAMIFFCFSLVNLFSGDNSPHDVWNETVDGQLAATRYIVNRTSSFLPGKSVYPVLGNHGGYFFGLI